VASVIDATVSALALRRGPEVPERVSARWTDSAHLLLLNHDSMDKAFTVPGKCRSLLTGQTFDGTVVLKGDDADFLEFE
jgi:hypothetical protein